MHKIALLLIATILAAPALCGDPDTDRVFRFYNAAAGDHFYTTDRNGEVALQSGYVAEGFAFRVITQTNVAGTSPVYRLFKSLSSGLSDHFYTASFNEAANAATRLGYAFENVLGYLYNSARARTVPVYRYFNPTTVDHFYTTNPNRENLAGYNFEGILGWAPNW